MSTLVAVVGMGLVVPGADSPSGYWSLHEAGIPQFSAPGARWPLAGYYSDTDQEDRSYAAQLGFVRERPEESGDMAGADRTAIWLRHALKSALDGIQSASDDRWAFVLGYTADGSDKLLDALTRQGATSRQPYIAETLTTALGRASTAPERYLSQAVAREAAAGLLPPSTDLLVVDAACSSGLYAVDLGMRNLLAGRADIAVCAGAFALGWRDMVLFSKLRGLSRSGDVRPMDQDADGVLFADGAAVVVLKPLEHAQKAGDAILGIVAGSSVSCDGRGKAIYAPRAEGQRLAIARAWRAAGVNAGELDAIVAHATGTPLGDITELQVLGEFFKAVKPISVVSPKSIVGHTGWCAGLVSLIHSLLMLKHGRIPRQHRFSALPPTLQPLADVLDIPTAWKDLPPWPDRPRAIGVSSFGFGGTNAHLVVMDDHPTLRSRTMTRNMADPQTSDKGAAIVLDWDAYLPGEPPKEAVAAWLADGGQGPAPRFSVEFTRSPFAELRLPPVTLAAMDPGQLMAVRAATRLRSRLGELWTRTPDRIGIFGGHMGPSRNGVLYALRCALGFLEAGQPEEERKSGRGAAVRRLGATVRAAIPAGTEDSYPGLMPNLVAGRVANVLDARGVNLVIDTGSESFTGALKAATSYIESGEIDFAVVLSVDANTTPEWTEIVRRCENLRGLELAEGVFAVLLAHETVAQREGLKTLARVVWRDGRDPDADEAGSPRRRYLVGDRAIAVIRKLMGGSGSVIELPAPPSLVAAQALRGANPAHNATGLERHAVRLIETPYAPTFNDRDFLVENCLIITNMAAPFGLRDRPAGARILSTNPLTPGARVVTGSNEAELNAAMTMPVDRPCRSIRLIVSLHDETGSPRRMLNELLLISDLCFLAVKATTSSAPPSFSAVILDAFDRGAVRPEAAIFTGFATALAEERSEMRITVLATAASNLAGALSAWGGRSAEEPALDIVYERDGRRWTLDSRVEPASAGGSPRVDNLAVVVAAGGASGITMPILLGLARRVRPKLWLLGTQDLDHCPEWIFALDDAAFAQRRTDFIRDEIRDGLTPVKAAQKYQRYERARQVRANLRTLGQICGPERVRYLACDVTDPVATTSAARAILAEDSRVDLLLFPAGIEKSARIENKTLSDFRAVRNTKILGYFNLKEAFASNLPRMWCNFGSVSAVIGAKGLVDYCAANAYLGAAAQHARGVAGYDEWTMGWPLWRDIGMGTQYRNLPWSSITPDEGVAFMLAELDASRREPYIAYVGSLERSILERRRPSVPAAEDRPPPIRASMPEPRYLCLDEAMLVDEEPLLAEHRIGGYPTMPAMLAVELAVRAARRLSGSRRPVMAEHVECLRFLRARRPGEPLTYRIEAEYLEDSPWHSRIQVRILADLITAKGVRLAQSVLCFAIQIVLSESFAGPGVFKPFTGTGRKVTDPYFQDQAEVSLSGIFANTFNIVADPQSAHAAFSLPELVGGDWSAHLTPILLQDACARIGVIAGAGDRMPEPAVISGIDRIRLFSSRNDLALRLAKEEIAITAHAVVPTGADGAGVSHCTASTKGGAPLLEIEGLRHLVWKGLAHRRKAG